MIDDLFQRTSCGRCGKEVVHVYILRGIPIIVDPNPDKRGRVTVMGQKFRGHRCIIRSQPA